MENKTIVNNTGIGFTSLLTLVFVLAKIFGVEPVASWSWVWVLAPVWFPFLIFSIIVGIVILAAAIASGK